MRLGCGKGGKGELQTTAQRTGVNFFWKCVNISPLPPGQRGIAKVCCGHGGRRGEGGGGGYQIIK